jgi:hypothetical protein
MEYYDATAQEVIKEFRTAESGLTSSQAQNRLKNMGKTF